MHFIKGAIIKKKKLLKCLVLKCKQSNILQSSNCKLYVYKLSQKYYIQIV